MKTNKRIPMLAIALVIVTVGLATSSQVFAQTVATQSSSENHGATLAPWSVQVDKVDASDVNLEPAFQIAIYENLLDELGKAKRFKQVLRDGDHNARAVADLLILKTTVQKYTPGSETRRAVTTVSGATKLTVRSQLCRRDGTVVLERTISGNVRFMGSNLRATHNLARNVAKAIQQTSLPQPQTPIQGGQL
jgi:hypothetical protein